MPLCQPNKHRGSHEGTDLDDCAVAFNLIVGCEGMDVAKFRPGEGNHAAGAIQLHSAASKRNHGVNQTEILGRKVVDIA